MRSVWHIERGGCSDGPPGGPSACSLLSQACHRAARAVSVNGRGRAPRAALEMKGLLLTAEIGVAFPEETDGSRDAFGADEASSPE